MNSNKKNRLYTPLALLLMTATTAHKGQGFFLDHLDFSEAAGAPPRIREESPKPPKKTRQQWAKTHLEVGNQHFHNGFFYPAICHYSYGLTDIGNKNLEIKGCLLFRRAVAGLRYSHNFNQALKDINASLDPTIPTAPHNRWTRLISKSNVCLTLKRGDEALETLNQAEQLNLSLNTVETFRYLLTRSKIREAIGQTMDAIQDLETICLNHKPDDATKIIKELLPLYEQEREKLTQNQLDAAIHCMGHLVSDCRHIRDRIAILLTRSDFYIRRSGTGDGDLALADLTDVLKNNPGILTDDQRLRILANQCQAYLVRNEGDDLSRAMDCYRQYQSFVLLPDRAEQALMHRINGVLTLRKMPLLE